MNKFLSVLKTNHEVKKNHRVRSFWKIRIDIDLWSKITKIVVYHWTETLNLRQTMISSEWSWIIVLVLIILKERTLRPAGKDLRHSFFNESFILFFCVPVSLINCLIFLEAFLCVSLSVCSVILPVCLSVYLSPSVHIVPAYLFRSSLSVHSPLSLPLLMNLFSAYQAAYW